jgi:hypothetical protein
MAEDLESLDTKCSDNDALIQVCQGMSSIYIDTLVASHRLAPKLRVQYFPFNLTTVPPKIRPINKCLDICSITATSKWNERLEKHGHWPTRGNITLATPKVIAAGE